MMPPSAVVSTMLARLTAWNSIGAGISSRPSPEKLVSSTSSGV
jgi:hypothetical protein